MLISAIIVTYNRPDALAAILESILRQKELPAEVVIADDGSGPETAGVIKRFRTFFPVELKHVWHEDRGFRGSAIRNRAVKESSGDYLVFSDGDLLFHSCFFADFRTMATPGNASIGSRVFLSPTMTGKILKEGPSELPGFFSPGIAQNRINALRFPLIAALLPAPRFSERLRGGLLGVFRKELEAVNGWNEEFSGWGLEDTELVARLFFNGTRLRKLKFSALSYHLWHPEAGRSMLETNRRILRQTIENNATWCPHGLSPSHRE